MVLLIISGILLLILVCLLYSPVVLHINTYDDKYYIGQAGTIRLQIYQSTPLAKFRLFLFGLPLKTIRIGKNPEKQKHRKKKQYKTSKRSYSKVIMKPDVLFGIIFKLIRSFKIREFYLNVDTGDVSGNAWLFPLAYLMDKNNLKMDVNYEGDVDMILKISNRPVNFVLFGIRIYWLHHKLK